MKNTNIGFCAALALAALVANSCYASQEGPDEQADSLPEQSCEQAFTANYKTSDLRSMADKLAKLKIKKDDFETKDAYWERLQSSLRAMGIDPDRTYYFVTKLDPKYIRYDADAQVLTVERFAVSNNTVEGAALFGYGSSLQKAGIELPSSFDSISLTFIAHEKGSGGYIGQNAFGATAHVQKMTNIQYGIYERAGSWQENVFGGKEAFTVTVSPMQARQIKQSGRTVIATKLKFPYYAHGTKTFTPSITMPTDRVYDYRYILADMQCAALVEPSMGVIAARPLR